MSAILRLARLGMLTADWRDHLQQPDYSELLTHNPRYRFYSDADTLLVHELQALPLADWEPYRDVGWRHALNAWLNASHAVLDDHLDTQETALKTMIANGAALSTIDSWRTTHQSVTARERDLQQGSYRAGLAAGGDPIDWRAWLRARITAWPDIPARATELDALRDAEYRSELDSLPTYWT